MPPVARDADSREDALDEVPARLAAGSLNREGRAARDSLVRVQGEAQLAAGEERLSGEITADFKLTPGIAFLVTVWRTPHLHSRLDSRESGRPAQQYDLADGAWLAACGLQREAQRHRQARDPGGTGSVQILTRQVHLEVGVTEEVVQVDGGLEQQRQATQGVECEGRTGRFSKSPYLAREGQLVLGTLTRCAETTHRLVVAPDVSAARGSGELSSALLRKQGRQERE